MQNISVLGAGHWGLALASVLASNSNNVLVYARDINKVNDLNINHKSVYIKDYTFSDNIKATEDLEEAINYSDIIVIALPVVSIVDTLKPYLTKYSNKTYVFTSKGLYKGETMSNLFNSINPNLNLAVLSGPSFSNEVIEKKFTAVTIASSNLEIAKSLQNLFSNEYFRVYTLSDVIGVEICGAIKNVFAIICGMVDGAKMGSNTKNAMITRGLAEMKRLISYYGGKIDTLYGLAGIGDIMLTCNSLESRNYSYGYSYVTGDKSSASGVVEGLNTVKEIHALCNKINIEMPITNALYQVLFENKEIKSTAIELMTRTLKNE